MSQNLMINTIVNSIWLTKREAEHHPQSGNPMSHSARIQHKPQLVRKPDYRFSPVNHTVSYR